MPIIGSKKWNHETKTRATLDEDFGLLHHKPTGEEDPLLCRQGVYFMKMMVSKKLLQPPPDEGFGRRGRD